MLRWNRICIHVLIVAGFLMPSVAVAETNPAFERVANAGAIDWIGEVLTATGVGSSGDKTGSPNQLRGLAERAAVVVARRNLLEVVKGIHIDAVTRVENYLVKDDTVETRVKGLLVNSRINRVQYLDATTAQAWVSIPLKGELRQALIQMVVHPPQKGRAGGDADTRKRLDALEKRVKDLESRIDQYRQANAEHRELTTAMLAWIEWMAEQPGAGRGLVVSGAATTDTQGALQQQAVQIRRLAARLDTVAKRLNKLEKTSGSGSATGLPGAAGKVRYTGLVIDARGTGFRPSLKPGVYAKAGRVYPGAYVIAETAITSGYVRYFKDMAKAQRSDRAGRLPLTIKAIGTHKSPRNVSISSADQKILKTISAIPNSFLGKCKVVIVF